MFNYRTSTRENMEQKTISKEKWPKIFNEKQFTYPRTYINLHILGPQKIQSRVNMTK